TPPAGSGQRGPAESPDEWSPSPRNQQLYNENASAPPDGPDKRIAGAPAAAAGTAAAALCLRFPAQCAAAAYLLYEGLKNAFDAIVQASSKPEPTTTEKDAKEAEHALRTNRTFRRWFHREYKPSQVTKEAGRRNPDLTPDQVVEAYREWLQSGKPTVK